jgi:hypothetical protein
MIRLLRQGSFRKTRRNQKKITENPVARCRIGQSGKHFAFKTQATGLSSATRAGSGCQIGWSHVKNIAINLKLISVKDDLWLEMGSQIGRISTKIESTNLKFFSLKGDLWLETGAR